MPWCGCSGPSCSELSQTCRWLHIAGRSWREPPPSWGPEDLGDPLTRLGLWTVGGAAGAEGPPGKGWELGSALASICLLGSFPFLSSLRFFCEHSYRPAFLSLFDSKNCLSLQFFVDVFGHLLAKVVNLLCGVDVSTPVGKFLLDF